MYPVSDPSDTTSEASAAPRPSTFGSLTYEPFYGLHEKPFGLAADPRFLFKSAAHAPAFEALRAGIRRREGLIVLTGEIGTGKTTLCRSVLQHLDRRTFSAFVADPFVSREDLLKTLLLHFGVISMADLARGRFTGASRSDLSYPLYEFLDSLVPLQAFAVVVIDEAQNLSLPLLEEIRVLSELERREKLLQVVLVGQPELREYLTRPEMRQVDQRVSVRCELNALDAAGVAGYVRHRLAVAGRGRSYAEFTAAALDAVYAGSSGVPRLINRICDRSLQRAFESSWVQVDAQCVVAAIADLGLALPSGSPESTAPQPAPAARPSAPVSPRLPVAAPVPVSKTVEATVERVRELSDEPAASALASFEAEKVAKIAPPSARRPSRPTLRGMAAGMAAALTVVASIGAPAWYFGGEIDARDVAMMIPARPAIPLPPATLVAPPLEATVTSASAGQGTTAVPTPAVADVRTPQPRSTYTILVASFQTPERAQLLVDELVNAGYGARTVDRPGGPTGRLVQVIVGGYTLAIDVERDLQRIRELPGGYTDAHVVEQH